jgi:hypothetical protein
VPRVARHCSLRQLGSKAALSARVPARAKKLSPGGCYAVQPVNVFPRGVSQGFTTPAPQILRESCSYFATLSGGAQTVVANGDY